MYTNNQVTAIKRLQFLSYNDDEFRVLLGFRNMRFTDIIECGFWTLEELEDIGDKINAKRTTKQFYRSGGRREPRKRVGRISASEQSGNKARSLSRRDGAIYQRHKLKSNG